MSAENRRGRPQVLSDDALLDYALDAFGRLGFDGVSLRALNRELAASPAMLGKRFGTKERLWLAAVDHGFHRHRQRLLAECGSLTQGTAVQRLERFIAAFIRTAAQTPSLQRVITIEGAQEGPRLEHLYREFIEPLMTGLVRPILDEAIQDGAIDPIGDREVFFVVANGAASVAALGPLSALFDGRDGTLDIRSYADNVARTLVRALRP